MDADEKLSLARLTDVNVSENDRSSCLDTLELMHTKEALPAMVSLLADSSQPLALREQAANAIHAIEDDETGWRALGVAGINSSETERLGEIASGESMKQLLKLLEQEDMEVKRLAKIALGGDGGKAIRARCQK